MCLSAVLHDCHISVSVLPVYVFVFPCTYGIHIYKTIIKVYVLYLIVNLSVVILGWF